MKKYGYYGVYYDWPVDMMDVEEAQETLPKGARIRNKKAKRRMHNKSARSKARNELNKELLNISY